MTDEFIGMTAAGAAFPSIPVFFRVSVALSGIAVTV
jgi:hypothetical protein